MPVGTCFEATSPQGAQVTYTKPTASDAVSGTATVTCDKASGSYFAAGTTTVTCTATDASGNSATYTFTVQVCLVLHAASVMLCCGPAQSRG